MNWEQVTDELNKPLERGAVKQRQQGTFKLSYIEGWHAIAEANRIFGHGNWDRDTSEMWLLGQPYQNDKSNWVVNYGCRVRISVSAGSVNRDGSGFGSGIDRDLGRAHESAIKEAETDATKRALMTFGWPFGLALYDKTQEHVSDAHDGGKAEVRAVEPAQKSESPYDVAPIPTTGISPKDFASVKGDPSSAQSGKAYQMLLPPMKANATASALTDWWKDHQDEIKALHTNGRWEFFMQMIEYGLSLCKKPLAVNLFWDVHLTALNVLKKADRYKFEELEEQMITRVAWLADPEAKVEFANAR